MPSMNIDPKNNGYRRANHEIWNEIAKRLRQVEKAICCGSQFENLSVTCPADPTDFVITEVTDFASSVAYGQAQLGGGASPNPANLGTTFPVTLDSAVTPGGTLDDVIHGWKIIIPECLRGPFSLRLRFSYEATSDSDGADTDLIMGVTDETFSAYTASNAFNTTIFGSAITGSYTPLSTPITIGADWAIPAGATEVNIIAILQSDNGGGSDVINITDVSIEAVVVDTTLCNPEGPALRTSGCLDDEILNAIEALGASGTLKQGREILTNGTWSPTIDIVNYTVMVTVAGTGPTFTDSNSNTTALALNEILSFSTENQSGLTLDTSPIVTAGAADTIVITYQYL